MLLNLKFCLDITPELKYFPKTLFLFLQITRHYVNCVHTTALLNGYGVIVIALIRSLLKSNVLGRVCLSVSQSFYASVHSGGSHVTITHHSTGHFTTQGSHSSPPPPSTITIQPPLTSSNVFNFNLTAQGPIPSGIFKPFYCATRTVSASGRLTFDKCLTCSTGIFIFHQN